MTMPYPFPVERKPMSWHDDLKRIADVLERAYPVNAYNDGLTPYVPTVTPSDDDEYVEEREDEATVEVLPPRCAHNHQVLRSNGDIGCADCPHVIIPKTGFNANGGPNLPAQ